MPSKGEHYSAQSSARGIAGLAPAPPANLGAYARKAVRDIAHFGYELEILFCHFLSPFPIGIFLSPGVKITP
jgi:hypothetical protein